MINVTGTADETIANGLTSLREAIATIRLSPAAGGWRVMAWGAGAEAAVGHDGQFGHIQVGLHHQHFGAVLGDTVVLVGLSDHKTGDVLQEYQGNLLLVAIGDKSCGLVGRIGIYYPSKTHFSVFGPDYLTLIGHNTNSPSIYPGISGKYGFSITLLILLKIRIINQALNNIKHVVRF